MSQPWTCRPYRDGDEAGILDLYREVFRLNLTSEYWRWAFTASPDGPSVIALIEMDGKVVGHYAVTPRKYWVQGELRTAGYDGATMLAPIARNVTTFVQMAKVAQQMCQDAGIAWLYGFPNAQALAPRLRLLDWKRCPDAIEWVCALPQPALEHADVQVWRKVPDEFNFDGTAPVTDERPVRSARSTAWLRWRFFDQPGAEYVMHALVDGAQITGYAITKRYNRDGTLYGHIVDWQLTERAADLGSELLASICRQLGQWAVDRISCWASGQPHLASLLAAAGLAPTGRRSPLCYDESSSAHAAALAEGEWRYAMADCDVF